jgi:hypothetical protein
MAHAISQSSTLRRRVIEQNFRIHEQVGPVPSQTPSSSHSELLRDPDGDIQTYDTTSDDFQSSQFANDASHVLENNGREMEDGDRSKWLDALDALQRFDDDNEVSAHEEAMQAANTANSTGGDVEEGGESQTAPPTSSIPAVDTSTTPNEDTTGLEPRATRTTSRTGTTDLEPRATRTTSRTGTTAPSRPIRSKKVDASGPSTRATCGN